MSASAGWVSEQARPEDEDLRPELREHLQRWRALYGADEATLALRKLRAALEDLATSSDDAIQAARASGFDTRVATHLDAAAYALGKRDFDAGRWSPAELREYAAQALKDLPGSKGGRPRVRHAEFAAVLLRLWRWSGRKDIPTEELPLADAIREYRKPARFIRDMFERVGIDLKDAELRAIRRQVLAPKRRE